MWFYGCIELVEDKHTHIPFSPQQKVAVHVIKEACRRGVMLRPLGDVLVLMPPLSMTEEEATDPLERHI